MRGLQDDHGSASVPDGFQPTWRSPPSGYADRNPSVCLKLSATLPATAQSVFAPGAFFALLLDELGDHLVTARTHGSSEALRQSGLDWRAAQYCHELDLPLSALAEDSTWADLRAAALSSLRLEAHRGGGKHRHCVWTAAIWLDRTGWGSWTVTVAARHLRKRNSQLDSLVEQFMHCAIRHDASRAWADIARVSDLNHWTYATGVPGAPVVWPISTLDAGSTVDWVHMYNLVPRSVEARLDQVAPPCPRPELGDGGRHDLIIDGRRVFVVCPASDVWILRLFEERDVSPSSAQCYRPGGVWFLSWLIKVGALELQALPDALAAEHLDSLKRQREMASAPKAPAASRPSRSLRAIVADMQSRTPSCLRGNWEASQPSRTQSLAKHFHEGTTHYRLRLSGAKGFTVFGVAGHSEGELGQRLLVGSSNPERAFLAFDVHSDGWDGQVSPKGPKARPRRLSQLTCPNCQGRHFAVHAAFEYPDDLDDSLEGEQRSHPEDFFTWFWLTCRCVGCNAERIVADIECA